MKLYFAPGACSVAPHIVMNELEMNVSLEKVNLANKTFSGGNYLTVNPKGCVPALGLDNGEVLTEASVIMQYLADSSKNDTLLPKSGMARFRVLEWNHFVSTEIHKTLGSCFAANRLYTDENVKTTVQKSMIDLFFKKLDVIENTLKNNTFLTGNEFTIADAYLFTCLNWKNFLGFDLNTHPNVNAYFNRIAERGSVRKAFDSEK